MAKVAEYFNFGDVEDKIPEELMRILDRMYTDLAVALNQKPDVYFRETDGLVTDTFLSNGDFNVNENTLKVEMLTEHVSQTAVTWTTLS